MAHTPEEVQDILMAVAALGSARKALFDANEVWIKAGKPENGPVAAEWHRTRQVHSEALAAVYKIADILEATP